MSENKVSKYQRKFNALNLSMSVERTYTSYFRNSIILFSLGLTVIGLTKKGENQKFLLALSLIFGGIVLGFTSVKEYYNKINLIKEERYDEFPTDVSNTIYIVLFLLILFAVLFFIKLLTMNQEHELFDLSKLIKKK